MLLALLVAFGSVYACEELLYSFAPGALARLAFLKAGVFEVALSKRSKERLLVGGEPQGYREAAVERVKWSRMPAPSRLQVDDAEVVKSSRPGYVLRLKRRWFGGDAGSGIVRLDARQEGELLVLDARYAPTGMLANALSFPMLVLVFGRGASDGLFFGVLFGSIFGIARLIRTQRRRTSRAAGDAADALAELLGEPAADEQQRPPVTSSARGRRGSGST
jgi:hypothetical protein